MVGERGGNPTTGSGSDRPPEESVEGRKVPRGRGSSAALRPEKDELPIIEGKSGYRETGLTYRRGAYGKSDGGANRHGRALDPDTRAELVLNADEGEHPATCRRAGTSQKTCFKNGNQEADPQGGGSSSLSLESTFEKQKRDSGGRSLRLKSPLPPNNSIPTGSIVVFLKGS